MYYYESATTDPYENLAIEEYLFETLPAGTGLFMLWQNRDAVIVGKYQNTAEQVSAAYVQEHGIAVVRRLSGGGAVYHDLGGLNYTLLFDEEPPCLSGVESQDLPAAEPFGSTADPDAVWRQCMAPLLAVLRGYGLTAQFSGRNDILVRWPTQTAAGSQADEEEDAEDGWRKIAGCAQYSRGGRVLHHGCILFDTDPEKVAEALTPGDAKYVSRSDKSVAARVTTIRACLAALKAVQKTAASGSAREPVNITMEQFRRDLRAAYGSADACHEDCESKETRFVPYSLTEEDRAAIRRLRDSKYRTWEWNFGYRADYQVHRERRFAGGVVAADLNVRGGRIEAVRLSGDFFAEQTIYTAAAGEPEAQAALGGGKDRDDVVRRLEQALAGLALDEHLARQIEARLAAQGTALHGKGSSPIRGVSISELTQLLMD